MYKINILLFVLLCSTYTAFSQNGDKVETSNYPINFFVTNVVKKGFQIQKLELPDSTYELIKHVIPQFRDADLLISAPLKRLWWNNQSYQSTFTLVDKVTNDTIYPSSWELENNDRWLTKKNTHNQILWKNITEDIISPESEYELIYTLKKSKKLVDCNCEYKFTFLKHIPYVLATLSGAEMLRQGNNHFSEADIAFNNAQVAYDNYLTLWQEGFLESLITENEFRTNGEEYKRGEGLLNRSENKAIWGYALMGSGIGGYFAHLIVNKINKKRLKKYCQPPNNQLKIITKIGFNQNSNNQQLGLTLTYTF